MKNNLLFLTILKIFFIIINNPSSLLSKPINFIKCEVLESSPILELTDTVNIQYLIIRQADDAERVMFSNWLKSNAGSKVNFKYENKIYEAYLLRLRMCFGRGILIFESKNKEAIERKSIILIIGK